jgi:hypothetical protein
LHNLVLMAARCVLKRDWTALINAVGNGHTATAAELVRLGADINAKLRVRTRLLDEASRSAHLSGCPWSIGCSAEALAMA